MGEGGSREGPEHWEQEWEAVDDVRVSSGAQGKVIRVRARADGGVGALKEMHPSLLSNRERRGRMAREVGALVKVRGPGTPEILAHNARYKDDPSVPLYFVSEWVHGPTLQEVAGDKSLGLEEAIRLARDLGEVVARCHAAGVLHRDIKPDNVIVSEGNRPVLVDFGIAWAEPEEGATSLETSAGQELGNRFLRLADYAPGRERRDPRSDVTMVVGVLFFLLTGRHPRFIVDEKGLPPHEAMVHLFPREITEDPRWALVRRIMRVGFQPNVSFRFQDAGALVARIDEVLDRPEAGEPVVASEEALAAFQDVVGSAAARARAEVETAILLASRKLEVELEGRASDADSLTSIPLSGRARISEAGRSATFSYTLCREGATDPYVQLDHTVKLVGPERASVRASYLMRGYTGPETEYLGGRTYYEDLAADTERLEGALLGEADAIFAEALRELTRKLGGEEDESPGGNAPAGRKG